MDKLSLQNRVFATYAVAATIMILKAIGMSLLTVLRNDPGEGRLVALRLTSERPKPGQHRAARVLLLADRWRKDRPDPFISFAPPFIRLCFDPGTKAPF